MKVTITNIENGWLIHYEIWRYVDWDTPREILRGPWEGYKIKEREKERAFTYDSDNELENTWKKVIDFIKECFSSVERIEYPKTNEKIRIPRQDQS